MTTNLLAKFTALEEQLATQHTAQLEATNLAVDKLSTIGQVLMGAAADIATVADTLLAIRAAIAPESEALPSIGKTSMAWSLYRLMDAVAPAWPRSTSAPVQPGLELLRANISTALGINAGGLAEDSLLGIVDNLRSNIGLPTGDATTTVLGRLATIENYASCICGPQPPSTSDPDGCAYPVLSHSPALTDAAFPGRLFAQWEDLSIYGLQKTTDIGLTVSNVELQPTGTWDGWNVFVYSRTAQTYSEDPRRAGRYPTNTWRSLEEAQGFPLAFSVEEGSDITVYLCTPPPSACPTWTTTDYGTHWVVDWTETAPTYNYVGDFYGYTARLLAPYTPPSGAAPAKLYMYEQASYGEPSQIPQVDLSDTPQVINRHTLFIQANEYKQGTAGQSFTIELCPPSGSGEPS